MVNDPLIDYATLIRGSTIHLLNELIDKADPLAPFVFLSGASAINDSGWIIAGGTDARDHKYHVYLLVTKEPAIRWERIRGGCLKSERDDD